MRRQEITDSQAAVLRTRRGWLAVCWAIIGLGMDWRCAFEWFAGKSSFYSAAVLVRALLIAAVCAGLALLVTSIIRETKWRYFLPLFCLFSVTTYRLLSSHWIAQRR